MNLYLIDVSSWVHRAFHALPPLTRPSDGVPVNAVLGFCNMVWDLMQGTALPGEEPATHMAAVFDNKTKATFRHVLSAAYKANRPPQADELRAQWPFIRQAIAAFGLPVLELEGFEADDLIATYTRQAAEAGHVTTIISSDKDLMQLLRHEGVLMFDTMRSPPKRIARADVEERWGVPPEKMIELQALMGDTTDNVPGVPGIGPKIAAELINQYGDLENLLRYVDDIKQPKRRAALIEHAANARLSKTLVTLIDDAPVPVALDAIPAIDRDYYRLIGFCKAMEFVTITDRVAKFIGVDPESVPALEAA